ncbi:MAG: guanylate kinase [Pseudomonadota bacterium]
MNKGKLFVISAPSGSGKSTVVSQLLRERQDIKVSISYTTREPRKGEVDGKDYYFVSVDQFKKMIDDDGFAEWALVYGQYKGTPRNQIDSALACGDALILDVDIQGGLAIREKYPETVLIFLLPPSFEELKRRLLDRNTDSKKDVEIRLKSAKDELEFQDRYDYKVINDEVENAVAKVIAIIDENWTHKR